MTAIAVTGTVRGRVQGVGFRYSMCRAAEKVGATGWVRNQPDGSVAFHAEGPADVVEALLEWARKGPRFGRVDALDLAPAEPAAAEAFEIRT